MENDVKSLIDHLNQDIENLNKVLEIFADAKKFLEDESHSVADFITEFDEKLEEAEQLIGRTYFDN